MEQRTSLHSWMNSVQLPESGAASNENISLLGYQKKQSSDMESNQGPILICMANITPKRHRS